MSINTSNQIAAIETHRLTKYYGKARGIIDLDMRVEVGEIFGFLGPNGAGKTTTVRTLLDLIRPSSGSATIFGLDVHRQSMQIKRRLGNLPGELALYPNLTGWQVLEYSANLRGGVDQREIRRLADRLDADLSRPMKAYSHGNKQKIGLIQAMMHKPELLMLDEPTTGLDPPCAAEPLRDHRRSEGAGAYGLLLLTYSPRSGATMRPCRYHPRRAAGCGRDHSGPERESGARSGCSLRSTHAPIGVRRRACCGDEGYL